MLLSTLSWIACRLSSLPDGGASLSLPNWTPPINSQCLSAFVPGTILNSLLINGTFLRPDNTSLPIIDPYIDNWLNNSTIPDISWIGSDFYTFVYRTTLNPSDFPFCTVPTTDSLVVLSASQISYRASLFVDGLSISTIDDSQAVGMFKRHDFILGSSTTWCNSTIRGMSILVEPPDHPGIPTAFCNIYPPNFNNTIPCGQGGNHSLAMDVISQDLAGWDFLVASPDRNTGIIDPLDISIAPSSILLRDGATNVQNLTLGGNKSFGAPIASGYLIFRISLRNLGTKEVSGTVIWNIDTSDSNDGDKSISAQVRVTLPNKGPWFEAISEPVSIPEGVALWWPHTVGQPILRNTSVSFVADGSLVDLSPTLFWRSGLRTISCNVDAILGGRAILVNSLRFYIEGGNFVGTDLLSRPYFRSSERYDDEVRLHASMGFNTMRLWAGHGGHPESLYTSADEAGVLLWNEFFMSGDNNGRWGGNHSWPLDHNLYNTAVEDTIRRLRRHPSLLVHVAGNELFPFNSSPSADILSNILSSMALLDPFTPFVQSSMGSNELANFSGFDPEKAWAPSDGPYGILDERSFFNWPAPGKTDSFNIPWAFQPELGASAHPSLTSLERFLSKSAINSFPGARGANVSELWNWHSYESFGTDVGGDAIFELAPPNTNTSTWNIREYTAAAGIVQVLQLRALFEGYADRMLMPRSGVLYWKSAGSWPALRGALYDWYLSPAGGYFGAKHALETIHVQLSRRPSDLGGASVAIINRGGNDLLDGSYSVSISAIDLVSGQVIGYQITSSISNINAQSVTHIQDSYLIWPPIAPLSTALLWRLELLTSNQTRLSRSEYILSNLNNDPKLYSQNMTSFALARTNPLLLNVSASCSSSDSTRGVFAKVSVSIDSSIKKGLALFIHCFIIDPAHGIVSETGSIDNRVLPIFPDDGFISILLGEEKNINIYAPRAVYPSTTLSVQCEGWNVMTITTTCSTDDS